MSDRETSSRVSALPAISRVASVLVLSGRIFVGFGVVVLVSGVTGCIRPSVREISPQTSETQAIALDTEHVCGRHDAAAFSQIPVFTATWRDLAERADRRPIDADALRSIARLMRSNREIYSDSRCSQSWIDNLEKSASE